MSAPLPVLTSDEEARVAESLAAVAHRATEVIGSAKNKWHAIGFVKSMHASLDMVSSLWNTTDPSPECKPGCSFCCSARVEVSDPEALYIAQRLLELPPSRLEVLTSRLRLNSDQRASSRLSRVSCAFLDDQQCSIYEHRPAACRKAHSLSAKACEVQAAQIPQSLTVVLQQEVLIEGTNRAYLANGLPASRQELSAAVLAVLAGGASADGWYQGRAVIGRGEDGLPGSLDDAA